MVHFGTSQRYFQREFQREFQRYTQPYPSSDVAVWKTGQGREKVEIKTCFKHFEE